MKLRKSALTFNGVEYDGLVNWSTRRMLIRATNEGFHLDFDDTRQELVMVWLQCTQKFDETVGVKFSTYFARAAAHEFAGVCRSLLGKNFRQTVSLNAKVSATAVGGEGAELQDLIEDQTIENPEAKVSRGQGTETTISDDPMVEGLFRISLNQNDPEIRRELEALRHQTEFARRLGYPMPQAPTVMTPLMLGKTFQFNWRNRQRMLNAMEAVS